MDLHGANILISPHPSDYYRLVMLALELGQLCQMAVPTLCQMTGGLGDLTLRLKGKLQAVRNVQLLRGHQTEGFGRR